MQGYQLILIARPKPQINYKFIAKWLQHEAPNFGVDRVMMSFLSKNYDGIREICSARFFEMADQTLKVIMVVDKLNVDCFLARLSKASFNLFSVKILPVEFGMSDEYLLPAFWDG